MPPWFDYLWYEATWYVSFAGFTLGQQPAHRGPGQLPQRGPVLVIANHQSFWDPLLIGVTSRRHLSFLRARRCSTNPAFAWVINRLSGIAIDQDGVGKEGIKAILKQLGQGRGVVVFPEGERTGDGKLHPLQPGIVLLIKRVHAPIIPVGIAGRSTPGRARNACRGCRRCFAGDRRDDCGIGRQAARSGPLRGHAARADFAGDYSTNCRKWNGEPKSFAGNLINCDVTDMFCRERVHRSVNRRRTGTARRPFPTDVRFAYPFSPAHRCCRSFRIALYFSSLTRSGGRRISSAISCTDAPSKLIRKMFCWRDVNTSAAT